MRTLPGLPRAEKGAYVLQFRLDEARQIAVGRLGRFTFQPGCYLYVGSARGGLRGRLLRHLRGGRMHWHLDYLLPHAVVEAAYVLCSAERVECAIAQRLADAWATPIPRFGASDCACAAHLFYAARSRMPGFPEDLALEQLSLEGAPLRSALDGARRHDTIGAHL